MKVVMGMKNNLPVFGIITAILLVFRILLNNNQQLVLVISSINLAALLIVVFSITVQIKTKISNKIIQSGVPQDIIKREKKQVCRAVDCYTYIPLAIVYIIYLFFFSCELGNDIISIFALGLSLSDTFISDVVANLYRE